MSAEETQVFTPEFATEPDPETNGTVPESSLLGQLVEMREQETADKHFDLEVPGYRGCLVLRLGPVGASVISKLRERAEKSSPPDRDLNANSDILITACREVLGRQHRDLELEQLDPEYGPVRIDEHLATILKLGTTSARASLLALWDKANAPEIAIGLAGAEYVDWARETQDDLDEEFLGKT